MIEQLSENTVQCKYISPDGGSVERQIPLSEAAELIARECILPAAERDPVRIVVSGGRGVKSAAGFAGVQELADCLGAEPGASRGAAASGFAPWDLLVGINGRTVRPDLYIACGISGALQHLFGMRTSGQILALTDDPTTPMYLMAHYAIVGDLKETLPVLLSTVRAVREQRLSS